MYTVHIIMHILNSYHTCRLVYAWLHPYRNYAITHSIYKAVLTSHIASFVVLCIEADGATLFV